jgi:hypothetical protein
LKERALGTSPGKVFYEEMTMTNELISMSHVEDRLTAQDDPGAWKEILAVLNEEFLQRYRAEQGEKKAWFLRIGTCSHWVRPHQSRWLAAGEFPCPSDTRVQLAGRTDFPNLIGR